LKFHGYNCIETSNEVWAVIHAKHKDLKVFSTVTQSSGNPHGNSNDCRMETTYGVLGSDFPIIGAETTWNKNEELGKEHERVNEKTRFYLFCVKKEDCEQ
jgi:hypothetical protein